MRFQLFRKKQIKMKPNLNSVLRNTFLWNALSEQNLRAVRYQISDISKQVRNNIWFQLEMPLRNELKKLVR